MAETKPTSTNACVHDFEDSPWEPGTQTCAWGCGATRETPPDVRSGVDVPAGSVVVRPARAAA